MPISPEQKKLYPATWKTEIRPAILVRAENACEGSPAYPGCRAKNGEPHSVTGSRVVLTIAHKDHDPQNNDLSNLAAWCQRCHLTYDASHHAENARRTRQAQRQA